MSEPKDFPKDAEQARLDRDLTREELTETLDALGHKLDVKTRAKEGLDVKIDQVGARIAATVSEPAAQRFRQGADTVRRNPLPVFAALLALLIAIRLAVRSPKKP
jgi:hypothetical protein